MHSTSLVWYRFCAPLIALILVACQQKAQIKRLAPLPQDPFIQVYFNHSESSEYVEPYRNQRRAGDDLEQIIVDAIAEAKSTVDVAVQELRLPKIARSLVERKKAGVKVRIILENTYNRDWSSYTENAVAKLPPRERDRLQELRSLIDRDRNQQISVDEVDRSDALAILKKAGIPIIDDTADGSKGSGLMHHKFVVIDGSKLIITSANFTTSDIHGDFKTPSSLGNANNLLKIQDVEIANIFTEEFNILWGDGPQGKPDSKFGIKKTYRPMRQIKLGETTVTVQFSPTSSTLPWAESSNGLIGKTLNQATQSIDMALFVFSEQRLANILESSHQRNVQIKALIDPDFAYRSYSEALDMMGVALVDACKLEPNNNPWRNPISTVGSPQLLKGDLLHHKFGVIDGKVVITGSHNWSDAANNNNDETVLAIASPKVAAHYQREFARLYANAQLGVPESIQHKIKMQPQKCPQITTASLENTQIITHKVNLNTAAEAELEKLPGVGKKLPKQIVQARQHKPFTSLQDLDKVPGVGSTLLEKLRDRVTW